MTNMNQAHKPAETSDADARWDELLSDPHGLRVLEQLAEEAHQEYLRGETQEMDDLYTDEVETN